MSEEILIGFALLLALVGWSLYAKSALKNKKRDKLVASLDESLSVKDSEISGLTVKVER